MGIINRRKHSPQFKFDVAVKVITTGKPAEVARQYGITSSLAIKWVTYLKNNGASVFQDRPDKRVEELKTKIGRLEQIIGQKETELALMKNFLDFYEPLNGK